MKQLLLFGCGVIIISIVLFVDLAISHGTVYDPVSRQTRWQFDSSAVEDYDHTGVFCGGLAEFIKNRGRCGVCGDNFTDSKPRAHELGGKYGQGTIVKTYKFSKYNNIMDVRVKITANHRGYFKFNICNLDSNKNRETDKCFNKMPLYFTNGLSRYVLPSTESGWFNVTLQIPVKLKCKHCVLRWTYVGGNNWGICPDGTDMAGCGPQEHFRACSDIRIK